MLPREYPVMLACNLWLLGSASGKWVEGRIDTKQNWAFLARFCFLSLEGQFEYLIEYDKEMGIPNLLLYFDDDSQWPAIYHSEKTCKEKEEILNKAGQNQIIELSHWYPETEISGCIIKRQNKEIPASKSTTSKPVTTLKPNITDKTNKSTETPPEPSYYDKFLRTTTARPASGEVHNTTAWFELVSDDGAYNHTTTEVPEDDLWENIDHDRNNTDKAENLNDVELLFDNNANRGGHKIKRSYFDLYDHYKKRHLKSEATNNGDPGTLGGSTRSVERLVVSCHNARRFRSARERWWFIAISNCGSTKGLDVRYKFLMTNGADGDFWHLHFSADEFYVLPILISYMLAYVVVMIAVVMCSVELKSRHLLHSTYKLFLISIVVQHFGIVLQSLTYVRYASTGISNETAKATGQFFCGMSEMSFLLLLVLMAKGYTITRGRLKVGFTVKLTIFMCCYCVTYVILFIYQAKAFDPGEVLYLYESPPGYGLIVLRIVAWCMFAFSTFFTIRKYPEKNTFYCPFFICGTLWFYAGPLFILTANSYIDKWVRESVVIAVLLFIAFCGHIMFLLLTLPVFANKNFPYHVRTTQIGVMEVTGSRVLDSFGRNAYHPGNGAAQTVIIPLTRRTEELIGNMYNQYMASAPPLSLEDEITKVNGAQKSLMSISPRNQLVQQDSTDTNSSDDINPTMKTETSDAANGHGKGNIANENTKVFTVGGQMATLNGSQLQNGSLKASLKLDDKDLPVVLRSKRNILEPIKKEEIAPPSWCLAKGPMMQTKLNGIEKSDQNDMSEPVTPLPNGKKAPPVKNGLQASSGEISTIMEGHVQSYQNSVSRATIDLFSVKK